MAKHYLGASLGRLAKRQPWITQVIWRLESGLMSGVWLLSRLLPVDTASWLGERIFRGLTPVFAKSEHFRRNYRLAFPDKAPAELESLVRDSLGNVGALLAEFPHLGRICGAGPDSRMEIVLRGHPAVVQAPHPPAVFVAAHLSNWEVAPMSAVRQGVPVTAMYTPMHNPHLDARLRRQREALGYHLVTRRQGVRGLLRELAAGRSIGLVVDQRVDQGVPLPFFGIDKNTTLVPARLALRGGHELIPVQVQRVGRARYRVIYHPPLRPRNPQASEQERILDLGLQMNALFETWIREAPGQWMCSKRRWAKDAAPPVAA